MLLNYFTFIAAFLNVGIGIFVWRSNPKKIANISFAIITFVMGAYILLNLFFQINPNDFMLKLIFSFGSFAISSLYIWPYSFTKESFSSKFIVFILFLFIVSVCASTISFQDGWLVKKVISPENVELGNLFFLYASYLIALLIGLLIYVYIVYKKTDAETKQRVLFSVIGLFIFILTLLTVSVVLPAFGITSLAVLDGPSSLFFIGFTAYAIVTKRLYGIKVILTETAIAIVVITLFIQTLLSVSMGQRILNSIVLILVTYGGYLIIKSVQSEIKQKERLQLLSTQLEQANVHLKELDEMKTEFVSLASHELLTPVSAIEGYLSMLLDEKMAKVEDPKALRYLDNVYKSAKRLARLIADMLNISRIEEGRLLVEKQDTDVSAMIQQVIDEVKFKAEERHQKIEFKPDGWESYADPDKFKEVVINIVGNSIKYSKGPGTILVTVKRVPTEEVKAVWEKIKNEIKGRPLDDQEAIKSAVDPHFRDLVGDEQLLISVKDEGVGIPREELPRLFKKFHRVGNYSTQESQGTGLGLYISRALIELQHGRIWADSEGEGKGSTFSFTLPDITAKQQILELEKQVKIDKEQLKPLAKPMKSAAEEL